MSSAISSMSGGFGAFSSAGVAEARKSIDQVARSLVTKGERWGVEYALKAKGEGTNGAISGADVLAKIKNEFPAYTLTDKDPAGVTSGKNLLYIDQKNLDKMAGDSEYRGKVMGLMRRELEGNRGLSFKDATGATVNSKVTGSVFSLSDKNASVDGIPYAGMADSESVSVQTSASSGGGSGVEERGLSASAEDVRDRLEKRREALAAERRKAAAAAAEKKAAAEKAALEDEATADGPIPGARSLDVDLDSLAIRAPDGTEATPEGASIMVNGQPTRFRIVV